MEALEANKTAIFGKPYFITQGDPVKMWEWIDQILQIHNLAPVSKAISAKVAISVAGVLELVARALNLVGVQYKPLLTRFLASEMSTHHYFSINAARRDLGYNPTRTTAEALSYYAKLITVTE
jgi:nucleoside-diphosphate-sugar epimerase